MVGTEAGIDPPLASESACARPGKKASEQQKEDGKCDPPNRRRSLPKFTLPQQRICDNYRQYAPAGAAVQFLWPFGVSFGQEEWRQPEEPSCSKDGVCVGRHAVIVTSCTATNKKIPINAGNQLPPDLRI